ncbi:hypothetical protein O181_108167 [Austropuccinia psidii MF-1]|uniref:Uncharacterized protein n=1 Tax=Austropuccinia psidii MF-1 TaxID=1389203 RepID=A0A9Q3JTP6_9BASI|nr:hypothetical protein [Austropuccinia psidii MF-1]
MLQNLHLLKLFSIHLHPFSAHSLVHNPYPQPSSKIHSHTIEFHLWSFLPGSEGWLLWDLSSNRKIQSTSVIFPKFNTSLHLIKASPRIPILNASLGKLSTEKIHEQQQKEAETLPWTAEIAIPCSFSSTMKSCHSN